ncbi:MAG: PEP-utilizing enzyme [Tepidiformaceae bacterium]
MTTSTYTCPDGTPFPVEWPEPRMEQRTWRWDQMHCPLPATALSQDLANILREGFSRAFDMVGAPMGAARLYVHGYMFSRPEPFDDDPAVRTAIRERDTARRIDRVLELWESEYRPEVEALNRSLQTWAPEAASLETLLDRFDQVEAIRRRQGELHMIVMGVANAAGNRFFDWCGAELGSEGESLSSELTQGFPNRALDSAVGLWDLSRLAFGLPAVSAALRSSPPGAFLAALDAVVGGPEFRDALDGYLAEFGERSESFQELSDPTWREDPRLALLLIRRYLDAPEKSSPASLHAASARRREERTSEGEARFVADPEKLATFRRFQKSAIQRTILLEDHNFYIDQRGLVGARGPCLALGRALVARGAMEAPDDVFHLHLTDIRKAACEPGIDLRALVSERKADRARWMRVLPPTYIGSPPAAFGKAPLDRFFGSFAEEPQQPGIVKGTPGSPGLVRGIARFIASLADIDRFGEGEILLTYATAPPWTPLFAIAAGIVTDAGGVLSHCAVVAREYGIPAVVGCRTATARIEDGMLITVDGTAGVVRIEE